MKPLFVSAVLGLLLVLPSCHPAPQTSVSSAACPSRWRRVAAISAPVSICTPPFIAHDTTDASDSWRDSTTPPGLPWSYLSVSTVSGEAAPTFAQDAFLEDSMLQAIAPGARSSCHHCTTYSDLVLSMDTLDGRPFHVETARVSGGYGHSDGVPTRRLYQRIDQNQWLTINIVAQDQKAATLFVRILRTAQWRAATSPGTSPSN